MKCLYTTTTSPLFVSKQNNDNFTPRGSSYIKAAFEDSHELIALRVKLANKAIIAFAEKD
jgi:hypothetical protein